MEIIVTEDEHERAVFRSRRMYESDLISNLATAEDVGRKKGISDVARSLLSMGLPISQIELATGLTEKEIKGF